MKLTRIYLIIVSCVGIVLALNAGTQEGTKSVLARDHRVMDAITAWSEWVEYQLAISNVPGASVGVLYDQELLFVKGYGFANPEKKIAAAPDTIYSICSNSKLFTSIALMQLREEGKLQLDDEVAKHLDWFAIKDVHPDDEPITIRRLLTHSSGLPRESCFPYWTGPDFPFPTHEEIVARLKEQETLYPSSRYFQYSNLGLTLAGEIVAAVSGRPFSEYIRTEILEPLGMKDTFTEIPAEHHGGRMAIGHSALKRGGSRDPMPLFQTRGIAPAAGFASTVEDLAKFASWQLRLLGSSRDEVLRSATLREMHRVHWVDPDWRTTWGLGFSVRKLGESTIIEHGGACPGYFSQVAIEPKSKLGVLVLSNAIGAEVDLYVDKAVELIGPAVAAAVKGPEGKPEQDLSLDRFVGIYDDGAWGQEAIVRWEDGLACLSLATRDPKGSLIKLKKVEENTFRRVREDDGTLGETFFFEVSEEGKVIRM